MAWYTVPLITKATGRVNKLWAAKPTHTVYGFLETLLACSNDCIARCLLIMLLYTHRQIC